MSLNHENNGVHKIIFLYETEPVGLYWTKGLLLSSVTTGWNKSICLPYDLKICPEETYHHAFGTGIKKKQKEK